VNSAVHGKVYNIKIHGQIFVTVTHYKILLREKLLELNLYDMWLYLILIITFKNPINYFTITTATWVWVGECFFWYRLTRVVPEKIHRAVKRLCVCVLLLSILVYVSFYSGVTPGRVGSGKQRTFWLWTAENSNRFLTSQTKCQSIEWTVVQYQ